MPKVKNFFYPLIVFLFAFSLYIFSIKSPLIADESYFIQRNQVTSLANSLSLFNKKDYDGYYYRPLPDFISGISTLTFKYNVPCYRLLNNLLHATAAVLVYYFFLLLLNDNPKKKLIALFAALFFACFPLHDYAVIWLTDLFERVMIIFYLAGLIAFIRKRFKPGFFSMLSFALSLLSKEMAFSFPLIIGLLYFYFGEKKYNLKKSINALLPYVIIMAAFILIRIILFNNDVFTARDAHSTGTLIDVVKNYFIFTGLLVFPFFLREMQSFLLMHKFFAAIIGIAAATGFAFIFFRRKKKNALVLFFILFIILTIAPASRLMMRWYLYLPSVGFTGLISYLIFSINIKQLRLPVIISISLLIVYSIALIHEETNWVKYSQESITALKEFIKQNRSEIESTRQAEFLTIPAKINDIPVFQLAFDKLFNFYFDDSTRINIKVDSKSYLNNFADQVYLSSNKNGIRLRQTDNNYFILFNNGKSINFAKDKNRNNKIKSLTFNKSELKNKILYTFSNGKFYKITGVE